VEIRSDEAHFNLKHIGCRLQASLIGGTVAAVNTRMHGMIIAMHRIIFSPRPILHVPPCRSFSLQLQACL
jgi:hypothetical protein